MLIAFITFASPHLVSQGIVEDCLRIMSRSTISSLESQLSTATHELELATFLNKGILQTNTEYKLRIAELESENIILRKAESRLAGTEDALEDAEKRIKVLEEERDVWEEELETAKENMESAKRDKDAAIKERDNERIQRELWEERFWELRGSLEGLVERANYQTGESSRTQSHQAKSKNDLLPLPKDLTPVPKIKPKVSASTGRLSRKPCLQSPIQPLSPPIVTSSPLRRPIREVARKRKWLAESESEEEDVFVPKVGKRKVMVDPLADSNYTEVESTTFESYVVLLIFEKTSSQIASPASSRVPFNSKRRGRQSNTKQQVEITMQVKEEPISPGYENPSEDSDGKFAVFGGEYY